MALSGVINGTVHNTLNCKITWSAVQSVSGNYSDVTAILTYSRTNSGYTTSGSWSGSITINGVTTKGSKNISISYNSNTEAMRATTRVYHDANGTKTITISATGSAPPSSLTSTNCSGSVTLDAIPRAATITSAEDFDDSGNPTITYSNGAGAAATSLQACIGNETGGYVYVPYRDISKTGTSYKFELTDEERVNLYSSVTNGNSAKLRFFIRTVVGGSTLVTHSNIVTFTLLDAEPTITPVFEDINEATVALTGDAANTFVKYVSNVKVVNNAAPRKGAAITSQYIRCGSNRVESGTATFEGITSGAFRCYAEDNRGNYAYEDYNKTIIDYTPVTCNQQVSIELSGETEAKVKLIIHGIFFRGSFGKRSNGLGIYYKYADEWVQVTTGIAFDGNSYYCEAVIDGLPYDASYTFQCKAEDALLTAYSSEYTAKLEPVFDWSESDFNFNVPVSFNGDVMDDFVISYGGSAMGSNGTWYWRKWKSGRAECYGCRNFGNMAVSTAYGVLYRSETFNQSFPNTLFVDTPEVIDISFRGGSFGAWIARHEETAPSATNTGSFIVLRPASATIQQGYICFNIVGRWK